MTENICIPQTETGTKKIPALMPPTVLPRKKNMRIFDENDIDSQLLVVAADHNNGATDSITTKNKTRLLKEIRSTSIPIAMQQAIPTTSIGGNKTRQTAGTAGKTHPQGTKAQRRQELHDRIDESTIIMSLWNSKTNFPLFVFFFLLCLHGSTKPILSFVCVALQAKPKKEFFFSFFYKSVK